MFFFFYNGLSNFFRVNLLLAVIGDEIMGLFDIFRDPDEVLKREMKENEDRYNRQRKQLDDEWADLRNEMDEDERLWKKARGNEALFRELKESEQLKRDIKKTFRDSRESLEDLKESGRRAKDSLGMEMLNARVRNFADEQYVNSIKREADAYERASKKWD